MHRATEHRITRRLRAGRRSPPRPKNCFAPLVQSKSDEDAGPVTGLPLASIRRTLRHLVDSCRT